MALSKTETLKSCKEGEAELGKLKEVVRYSELDYDDFFVNKANDVVRFLKYGSDSISCRKRRFFLEIIESSVNSNWIYYLNELTEETKIINMEETKFEFNDGLNARKFLIVRIY